MPDRPGRGVVEIDLPASKGELILTLDGAETRYGPGQWYHVPADATHAARFEKDTSEIEFWLYRKVASTP